MDIVNTHMRNRLSTIILLGAILFPFCMMAAAQTIVFDEEIYWEWPTAENDYGGYGFYWWHQIDNPNYGEMPTDDWLSPDNYFDGEFRMRFEVLEQPTDEPFMIQFGIWQDKYLGNDHLEQVSSRQEISKGTVFDASIGTPNDWWSIRGSENELDFSRPEDFYRIGLILWNPSPLCIPKDLSWGADGCPEYKELFFPMRARVTVTAFPESGGVIDPPNYSVDYYNERTMEQVSVSDQWSRDNSTWTNGEDETLSLTPGEDLYFRKRQDYSKTQTLVVKERPGTPAFTIDYYNERTTETISNEFEYSTNSGMTGAEAGTGDYLAIMPGNSLYFRHMATESDFRSDIQELPVPGRPPLPAYTIDYVNERTNEAVPATDEYAGNPEMTGAVAGGGAKLDLTPGSDLYFRTIATASTFKSETQHLDVPDRHDTPSFGIDFAQERTTVVVETVTEVATSADMAGAVPGPGDYLPITPGINLYFRHMATESGFLSGIQELLVPGRPASPGGFGIDYFNETTDVAVEANVEYSTQADMIGAVTGTGAPGTLIPGKDHYFRFRATGSSFASEKFTLAVPGRPTAPSYTIDYLNERTNEAVPLTDEYATSPDMSGLVSGSGSTVAVTPGEDLYFRTSATPSVFSSEIQILDVPDRHMPSFSIDFNQESTAEEVSDVYIYAASADMSGASTGSGNRIPVTPGSELHIQRKATATAFVSDIQSIFLPDRPDTPSFGIDFPRERTTGVVETFIEVAAGADMAGAVPGPGDYLPIIPGNNLYFRHMATESDFRSGIQELLVPGRPATPGGYGIDYLNETTNVAVEANVEYSTQADMSGAVAGTGSPGPLVPGMDHYFRVRSTSSSFASEKFTLVVPGRPPLPAYSIDYVNERTNETVPATVEYAGNPEMTGAVAGGGAKLDLTPGSDLYFRTLATASTFKSETQHLDVPDRHDTPSFGIDFAQERTTMVVETVTEVATSADMAGAVPGPGDYLEITPGINLYFRHMATESGFLSGIQELLVPGRPASPGYGIDYINETTDVAVETDVEYSTHPDMNGAVTGTGAPVVVIPGEDLYFRIRSTGSSFASEKFTLSVPGRLAAPSYTIDYVNERTNEAVPSTDEYTTLPDMSGLASGSGSPVLVYPGEDLYFRTRATSSVFSSEIQTLDVPDRHMPSFSIDFSGETTAEVVSDAYIYAASADMSGASTGSGNRIPVTPGSELHIQRKATATAFISDIQSIILPDRPATPSFGINFALEKTTGVVGTNTEVSSRADMAGALPGPGDYLAIIPGSNLYFRHMATESDFRSDIQELLVPGRPGPPSYGIDYINETTDADVEADVEYSAQTDMSGAVTGTGAPGSVIPGENLYFRVRSTSSSFASETFTLVVPDRPPVTDYTIDYVNEWTNESVPATDEYADTTDMSGAMQGTGTVLNITPGENLYFRRSATMESFASDIQVLNSPLRPVISSDEEDITELDPFVISVTYFQPVSNLSTAGIYALNASVPRVELTTALETITIYQATIAPFTAGKVTLQVMPNSVTEGCFKSDFFRIQYQPGTRSPDQYLGNEQMTLYPNPTTGKIRITSSLLGQKGLILRVYSLTGRLVHAVQPAEDQSEVQLDLGHLDQGMYMLKLSSASAAVTRKVILQGQ